MAARQPARASPELRKAPPSPRYPRNYTTPWGTTIMNELALLPAARMTDPISQVPAEIATLRERRSWVVC